MTSEMAGEREALRDAINDGWHGMDDSWIDYQAVFAALAARGWRLVPEPLPREALDVAADRIMVEITRQRSVDVQLSPLYAAGWEDAARFLRRLAALSPEPLPREALDVERLARARLDVMATWLPMIAAGTVPHGPKGECPEPELCSALIEAALPREALDVDLLTATFIKVCNEHGWSVYDRRGGEVAWVDRRRVGAALFAALSPDRPTPP